MEETKPAKEIKLGQNAEQGQSAMQGRDIVQGQNTMQGQNAMNGQNTVQGQNVVQGQIPVQGPDPAQDQNAAQEQQSTAEPIRSQAEPSPSCGGHCCYCHRKKERSEQEYKDLMNRLNRIEGQIRGIKGMVERDAYCPDILTQVAAANAALSSFAKRLLASHIRTCVADDIRAGNDETIDELLRVLQKLMR